MSIQNININDLYNMDLKDLKELVNNSTRIANQQIKELENTGYAKISQAYRTLSLRQGKDKPSFSFPTDDLNKAQLVNKYIATQSFLQLKTSSVSGVKQANTEILQASGATQEQINEFFDEIEGKKKEKTYDKKQERTQEQEKSSSYTISEFWSLYSKIKENDKGLINSEGSQRVMSLLRQVLEDYPDRDYEDVINHIYEKIQEEYEEQAEQDYENEEDIWQDL